MISRDRIDYLINKVETHHSDNFTDLVRISGLDPTMDFRYANLRNIDLSGLDLTGFDFTGANLSGCKFFQSFVSGACFDGTVLDEGALRAASDWEDSRSVRDEQTSKPFSATDTRPFRGSTHEPYSTPSRAQDSAYASHEDGRIFLSSQRESLGIAGRLYDRLTGRFGNSSVFMNIEPLPPGIDFRDHISEIVGRARVFLALISSTWLRAVRLGDDTNIVRLEMEMAFARGVPVIPVLLGHTPMPKAEELPDSISRLAYLNARRMNEGHEFNAHAERLVRELDARLRPASPPTLGDLDGEFARYAKECDALIMINPENTLFQNPRLELIEFRNLINTFRAIERSDGKKRLLILIVDLGSQRFDDPEARMKFLGVQILRARLQALKSFEDNNAAERWAWLEATGVVVLLDTRGTWREEGGRPSFTANNLSLTTPDTSWLSHPNLRKLYGAGLENFWGRNFSVFVSRNSENSKSAELIFRYFGNSAPSSNKSISETLMLELPQLPQVYTEALKAACEAAFDTLSANKQHSDPVRHLHYLGYSVLRISEFIEHL